MSGWKQIFIQEQNIAYSVLWSSDFRERRTVHVRCYSSYGENGSAHSKCVQCSACAQPLNIKCGKEQNKITERRTAWPINIEIFNESTKILKDIRFNFKLFAIKRFQKNNY